MHVSAIKEVSVKIVNASRELYAHGLVRGTSGNISARIAGTNTFLIKASGVRMKILEPEELVLVDLQGNKIRGELNVSMETPIHAAIYRARKDVQAVAHTHAPTATAFGISKTEILPLQIEMFMLLPNGVPVIPFKAPGSKALAEEVQKKIENYDAVILENHGIITVGSTIEAACNLNEMVEEGAKIQLLAMTLSGRDGMNLAKLKEKFKTENTVE
ncbi:MAG: class II aldolase/adducin family protein [Candidatus Bathyarchaeota archaeon]|nr:MAG: class II aldolase/adducin family protein [Candidatus Bathyarchaeota archaeon]